jgi:ubiquinone/menaquinone biosynthesis C-methylase UbiE
MRKPDYDRISSTFDKGRSLSEENLQIWLELIAQYSQSLEGAELLDLGCGTGRFSLPIAQRLLFRVTGADSSYEMLNRGREKDSKNLVKWDWQDAANLTYPNGSFDIVFMSQLLHNVDVPLMVLKQCNRVLREQGTILIRYGSLEQISKDVEHVFFPEILPIDEIRWPSVSMVESWLGMAGFINMYSTAVTQRKYKDGIAHLKAIATKSMSVLTLISDEAFERGFRRLEEYVKNDHDNPWLIFTEVTLTAAKRAD